MQGSVCDGERPGLFFFLKTRHRPTEPLSPSAAVFRCVDLFAEEGAGGVGALFEQPPYQPYRRRCYRSNYSRRCLCAGQLRARQPDLPSKIAEPDDFSSTIAPKAIWGGGSNSGWRPNGARVWSV